MNQRTKPKQKIYNLQKNLLYTKVSNFIVNFNYINYTNPFVPRSKNFSHKFLVPQKMIWRSLE